MANRTKNRTQQNEPAPPSRTPIIVLTAGSIAVAALVGWALTRTVEPAVPEAATVATAPAVTPTVPAGSTATEPFAPAPSTPTAPPLQTPEGAVARITPDQLKQMVDTNAVTLVDVRDSVSYTNGHIPGAIHIPFARVEAEGSRLPKGKPIVAYCT
jgi:hypothetical protein